MKPESTVAAYTQKLEARRIRQRVRDCPDHNQHIDMMDLRHADLMDYDADRILVLANPPVKGVGGELAPSNVPGQAHAVQHPDQVSLEASVERVGLADRCGVFNLGLDAAETVGASNALEQMLTHQMAAAHKAAMDLLAKASQHRDSVEAARLTNASSRLMSVYQHGMLTLNRLRTGGKQTVTVQHVNVGAGGQAVIGNVQTGGGVEGEIRNNG